RRELGGGPDQEQLAFLFGESADADESFGVGNRSRGRIQKGSVDAAMDDVDFAPFIRTGPAIKLAAPKFADGGDKTGALDLFADFQELGLVKFFGTMAGEAVRRPA